VDIKSLEPSLENPIIRHIPEVKETVFDSDFRVKSIM